jgi:hypothetical protein
MARGFSTFWGAVVAIELIVSMSLERSVWNCSIDSIGFEAGVSNGHMLHRVAATSSSAGDKVKALFEVAALWMLLPWVGETWIELLMVL